MEENTLSTMTFKEYQNLTNSQKELHNFELLQKLYDVAKETRDHAKMTNGRVCKLETWNNIMKGAIIILSAVVLPVAIKVLELHITN